MIPLITIGIVGTGHMAGERAGVFHETEHTSVAGVYARRIEKTGPLCEATGAKAFDDYGDMLANVDAVVICLANDAHAPYALRALNAGKHVLVEYPLCTNADDAHALQDAAEKAACVLMVGNTIIHEAPFQYLADHKERLGQIISASSRVVLYSEQVADAWYLDRERIGPVFAALHYHHIEYYRRFLGEVEWVLGCDQSMADPARPSRCGTVGGTMTLGHIGGARSSIQWYLSAHGDGLARGMWLNGSESSVTIVSMAADTSQVIWDAGGPGKIDVLGDQWGVAGSCRDFVDAIAGRLDHKARLRSDMTTLNIGLAGSRSAAHNKVVHLVPL